MIQDLSCRKENLRIHRMIPQNVGQRGICAMGRCSINIVEKRDARNEEMPRSICIGGRVDDSVLEVHRIAVRLRMWRMAAGQLERLMVRVDLMDAL